MFVFNIHEAKTNLSRLVEGAINGEPFVIAKSGTPLVRVEALQPPSASRRLGFLAGHIAVPDDFDSIGAESIAAMFEGGDTTS